MDLIRASHVLEHIPQPKAFVEGCFNTLKSGGVLMVIVPNGVPWIQALVNFKRRFQSKKPKLAASIYPYMHVLGFSRKSLTYLMRETGFAQISMKSVSMGSRTYYPWFYDGLLSRQSFAKYWRGGNLQSKIPQLLAFLGNSFGRGEWLVGYFRKP